VALGGYNFEHATGAVTSVTVSYANSGATGTGTPEAEGRDLQLGLHLQLGLRQPISAITCTPHQAGDLGRQVCD